MLNDTVDREMVIERLVDAPRELVFRAFTEPEHVKHWWGPNGFTNTIHEMDVRPGGVWRFIMHGPDGTDYPNKIVYVEVLPPERLVYEHSGDRPDGPVLFRSTVTLDDAGGKTKVTLRALFPSADEFRRAKEFGAAEGGQQTLARLAEYVKTMAA
ncbi:MAG: SRPBCC domain-containing protein [Candidatus Hydrogenedentes bacterium]|nr:SRPBCC domain-containing protein [Candidatus Hydrogenedentota bacterium]